MLSSTDSATLATAQGGNIVLNGATVLGPRFRRELRTACQFRHCGGTEPIDDDRRRADLESGLRHSSCWRRTERLGDSGGADQWPAAPERDQRQHGHALGERIILDRSRLHRCGLYLECHAHQQQPLEADWQIRT